MGDLEQRHLPLTRRQCHHYALIDEANSIFIDEARTPMVIGGTKERARPEEQIVHHWADRVARAVVRGRDFGHDQKRQKIELTSQGNRLVRWSEPPCGPHAQAVDKLHEHVERALHAHHSFRRDQQYLIDKDDVVLIDEYTCRRMPGRHRSDGLHQAVEAKEGVPVHSSAPPSPQGTRRQALP
jgi:preprotein translocase subunit SecA